MGHKTRPRCLASSSFASLPSAEVVVIVGLVLLVASVIVMPLLARYLFDA